MDHIGRYEIVREIGRGGMGIVYEAVDPVLGRHLAIKLIRTDTAATGRERNESLVREARSAASLSHPNIVTIYDVGVHEGNLYVVMELIKGASLRRAFEAKTMPREVFVDSVLPQIADALDYAHSHGIVHRDIKPSNITMREDGVPCLVDFGMADLLVGDKTQPGLAGGTIAYVAPEQIRGESLDGRADQFSLAVVTYEAITGSLPFGAGQVDTLQRILSGAFQPPSERDPTLPSGLNPIFAQALSRDPASRYSKCAEFAIAVSQQFRTAKPGSASFRPPAPQPPPPPQPVATAIAPSPPTPPPSASAGEFTRMFRDLQKGAPAKPAGPAGEFTQIFSNLEVAPAPTGFLTQGAFSQVFSGEKIKFDKIEGTLRFYRDRLSKQYDNLERQAQITYILWICCVALGFAALIGALVFIVLGRVPQGSATLVSSVVVYFIQRIFQQREDQYRRAADQKNEHLEYGNRWLLAIQTIESVEDPISRARCQARLAYELTKKLGESGGEIAPKARKQSAK